jgi:hypothetical protein
MQWCHASPGATRTRQVQRSPSESAESTSKLAQPASGLKAGVRFTMTSRFGHGPMLRRFAGDAKA